MIGQTISQYAPKAHPPLADKIIEKLGEVPKSPTSGSKRVAATLRIPPLFGGSGRSIEL
jgi:hypothetical protein